MMDALRRTLDNSSAIGSTAVITGAKDGDARRFYRQKEWLDAM